MEGKRPVLAVLRGEECATAYWVCWYGHGCSQVKLKRRRRACPLDVIVASTLHDVLSHLLEHNLVQGLGEDDDEGDGYSDDSGNRDSADFGSEVWRNGEYGRNGRAGVQIKREDEGAEERKVEEEVEGKGGDGKEDNGGGDNDGAEEAEEEGREEEETSGQGPRRSKRNKAAGRGSSPPSTKKAKK